MTEIDEDAIVLRSVRTTALIPVLIVWLGGFGLVFSLAGAPVPAIGFAALAGAQVEHLRTSFIRVSSTWLVVGRPFRRPLSIDRSDIRSAYLVDERRGTTGSTLVVETDKVRRLSHVHASGNGRSELAKIGRVLMTGAPVELPSRWWA